MMCGSSLSPLIPCGEFITKSWAVVFRGGAGNNLARPFACPLTQLAEGEGGGGSADHGGIRWRRVLRIYWRGLE